MLRGLLDEAGIPYYVHDRDSSSYLRIVAGYSSYGTDFFVPAEEYEKAKELTDAYFNPEEGDTPEDPPEAEEGEKSEPEGGGEAEEDEVREEKSSSGLSVPVLIALIVLALIALVLIKTLL